MEDRERRERESKTLAVVLSVPTVFSCLSEFLTFKEYTMIGILNKRFH